MNLSFAADAKFELGLLFISDEAQAALLPTDVTAAVRRHLSGDWGNMCEEDKRTNDEALQNGGRLFSEYISESGIRFWAITEWNRSATTVLLPHEY